MERGGDHIALDGYPSLKSYRDKYGSNNEAMDNLNPFQFGKMKFIDGSFSKSFGDSLPIFPKSWTRSNDIVTQMKRGEEMLPNDFHSSIELNSHLREKILENSSFTHRKFDLSIDGTNFDYPNHPQSRPIELEETKVKTCLSEPTLLLANPAKISENHLKKKPKETFKNANCQLSPAKNLDELSGYLFIRIAGKTYKAQLVAESECVSGIKNSTVGHKRRRKTGIQGEKSSRSKAEDSTNKSFPRSLKDDLAAQFVKNNKLDDFEIALIFTGAKRSSKFKSENSTINTKNAKLKFDAHTQTKSPEKMDLSKKRRHLLSTRKGNLVYPKNDSSESIPNEEESQTSMKRSLRKQSTNYYVKPTSTRNASTKYFDQYTTSNVFGRENKLKSVTSGQPQREYIPQSFEFATSDNRQKRFIVSSPSVLKDMNKHNQNYYQDDSRDYAFETQNFKPTCRPSISEISDIYKLPKLKISEEVLWEKFEKIFRKYASTTRHSGEVIPRKISTEWLMDMGIVDDIISETQADEAFKLAAGAKITMNAIEYKEFLIMLSLRVKLPYYELYRKMCGV